MSSMSESDKATTAFTETESRRTEMEAVVDDWLAEVTTIVFDLLLTVALTGAGISAELHSM